jgi:tellurite resistance protein TerC
MTARPATMPVMDVLFPISAFWWFYGSFTLFVLAMLVLDLGVFHRHAHVVGFRESLAWSVVWVALALAFNYGFYLYAASLFGPAEGQRLGLEFLTGYLIEKSLAVDNIFVFVLVFAYFGIPPQYQHRVLFYGILGALIFRAIFIALGSVLMQYSLVVTVFGLLLIATGAKMLYAPDQRIAPDRNPVVRLFRRLLPVTPDLHGQRFLVTIDGRRHATPLLVALVFLELSDVIFAVDSVPAIFAISAEPLIVFTSNVFAILGLRAMYFLLAGAVERFHMLKYALATILIFVGLKMVWLNDAFGGKFPIGWSLAIIAALLTAGIVGSLLSARAGSVLLTEAAGDRVGTTVRTTQKSEGVR